MSIKFVLRIAAAIAGAACSLSPAVAAVTINIFESGPSVSAVATGTLDLTGLSAVDTVPNFQAVRASVGLINVGANGDVTRYSGMTGPAQFGPGNILTLADLFSGMQFGINASGVGTTYVAVPANYVSGTAIAGQATFLFRSLSSLGLTPGQYVYSSANDTVTINIGSVPEPSTWAFMLLGLGALGIAVGRGRQIGLVRPGPA